MRDYRRIIVDQREGLLRQYTRGALIKREVLPWFQEKVDSKMAKVIMGIRRCGKSTFCTQLLENRKYGYVNFDDEKLAGIEAIELNDVLQALYEVYGKINTLFLDEVQNVKGWELFVNRLLREGMNVIVTGSNAKLLSKELATHLTGRHLTLELFPFSFTEFLRYKGIDSRAETTEDLGRLKNSLNEYLLVGGFPEALTEPDPILYLKNLYSTILLRDILQRYKIKRARTFRDLADYLFSAFGREISYNKLKGVFGLGSDHTAKNYLSYLEESYLLFFVERFSYKKKESILGNRKSYVIDTGMIRAVSFRFQEDFSHVYENVVAIELLRKKSRTPLGELYYWKNPQQEEVDFLVKEGLERKQLIQVCYDLNDPKTKNREIRSLLKASQELQCRNLLIITSNQEGEEEVEWLGIRQKIRFMPLWKWLLEK